eukprot:SAG31_NODE_13998_length_832_cov_77.450205_1_plen_110_part_01
MEQSGGDCRCLRAPVRGARQNAFPTLTLFQTPIWDGISYEIFHSFCCPNLEAKTPPRNNALLSPRPLAFAPSASSLRLSVARRGVACSGDALPPRLCRSGADPRAGPERL